MTVGGLLVCLWGVCLYDCGGSACMTVGGTVWLLLLWGVYLYDCGGVYLYDCGGVYLYDCGGLLV